VEKRRKKKKKTPWASLSLRCHHFLRPISNRRKYPEMRGAEKEGGGKRREKGKKGNGLFSQSQIRFQHFDKAVTGEKKKEKKRGGVI